MSIFDRFFGRESKTLFSQHNTKEVVVIDRVKSFQVEFLGKSNRVAHDGQNTLLVRRGDDIILNGVYCRLDTAFEVQTPFNEPTVLEDVTAIHKFKLLTAGDKDGVRLDVEISDAAIYETLDYLKTHISFNAGDVELLTENESFA